jgi:hypothetical protein
MFVKGASVEQVVSATSRAPSTVWGYLAEFIETYPSQQLDPWVDSKTYHAVAGAAADLGAVYQKPIFDRLDGKVPFEHIRLVLTHLNAKRVGATGVGAS